LQLDHQLYPAQQIEQGGSGFASVEDPFFSALKNKKKSKNKKCKKKCLGKELDDRIFQDDY
jgi:hypothetical protein